MKEFLKNDRFAAMAGVELLEVECGYAEAREVVSHHRLPFIEVSVTDEAGEVLAVYTATGYRKSQ
jgi:acyl-coenzyme A thioesterase PaaI-like protein